MTDSTNHLNGKATRRAAVAVGATSVVHIAALAIQSTTGRVYFEHSGWMFAFEFLWGMVTMVAFFFVVMTLVAYITTGGIRA